MSEFSVRRRVRSVGWAMRGIGLVLRTQHNAWVHAAATVGVVTAGVLCGVSRAEWCLLVLAMMAVWTAEAMNTAVELVCDYACPEKHAVIGMAKDVAAGAVLLSALGAAVVGAVVFLGR